MAESIVIRQATFVGGSLDGATYLVFNPRPGERKETPDGELYFWCPISNRFLCRWPPYSYRADADRCPARTQDAPDPRAAGGRAASRG